MASGDTFERPSALVMETVDVTLDRLTVKVPISEGWLAHDTMNIFVLDADPRTCAQMHCDKHVCKMSIEYAMLLCNARHAHDWKDKSVDYGVGVYHPLYMNHPCSKWAAGQLSNYLWLLELTYATWEEYRFRYGMYPTCEANLRRVLHAGPEGFNGISTHVTVATAPPQCMPEQYRVPLTVPHFRTWENAVTAYQLYYLHEKYRFAKWTTRSEPAWFTKGTEQLDRECFR